MIELSGSRACAAACAAACCCSCFLICAASFCSAFGKIVGGGLRGLSALGGVLQRHLRLLHIGGGFGERRRCLGRWARGLLLRLLGSLFQIALLLRVGDILLDGFRLRGLLHFLLLLRKRVLHLLLHVLQFREFAIRLGLSGLRERLLQFRIRVLHRRQRLLLVFGSGGGIGLLHSGARRIHFLLRGLKRVGGLFRILLQILREQLIAVR